MAVVDSMPVPVHNVIQPDSDEIHFGSRSRRPLEENNNNNGLPSPLPCGLQQIRLLSTTFTQDWQKHVSKLEEKCETFAELEALEAEGFLLSQVLQSKTLIDGLSPQNCIGIRRLSTKYAAAHQLTSSCDAFIQAHFSSMLNEKELISLPRVQVNVDISEQLDDLDTRAVDCELLERIVPLVVRELWQYSSAFSSDQFLVEKLVVMKLMSDFSVHVAGSKKCSKPGTSLLSPGKPLSMKQPSPLRRLQLAQGESKKPCDSSTSSGWEILAVHTIGMGALVVVKCSDLLLLNVQMVSRTGSANVICPISPTTGIPLAVSDSFLSQMVQSRSGFGLASVGSSLIMSVGGFGRAGVLRGSECFDLDTNSWLPGCKLTTPRARHVVVQHEDLVYAIGGSDGKVELGSMEVFSNKSKSWAEFPAKLCTARSDFGGAVLDGRIYAIGGMHYSSLLRSAEVFDPARGQWAPIAPMPTPRRGVAVVTCKGSVYAIGGQGVSWGCLNSVERYDAGTAQWCKAASMSMPRRNACTVAVKDLIYVIGGYNGSVAVNVMEVYDPASNKWSRVSPMALKRSSAAALLHNEAIYVVGGFSGSVFLNSVEKYDLRSEQWTSYFRS